MNEGMRVEAHVVITLALMSLFMRIPIINFPPILILFCFYFYFVPIVPETSHFQRRFPINKLGSFHLVMVTQSFMDPIRALRARGKS